jgi:hypothetical protein
MRADQSGEDALKEQLASIVGRGRRSTDERSRDELFAALSRLERQALVGGGSDEILKSIAEVRFLAGILRDAVRPPRPGALRTALRSRRRSSLHRGTHRRVEDGAGTVRGRDLDA